MSRLYSQCYQRVGSPWCSFDPDVISNLLQRSYQVYPNWSEAPHMTGLKWAKKTGLLVWNKPGLRFVAAFHLWCLREHFEFRSMRVLGTLSLPVWQQLLGLYVLGSVCHMLHNTEGKTTCIVHETCLTAAIQEMEPMLKSLSIFATFWDVLNGF